MRLLLVEDDPDLRGEVVPRLVAAGFAVDEADNGVDGEFLGTEVDYDAVVLDLGLPDRDGLQVLRNWRARGLRLPVLVLTARGAWFEKVEGFKAGADDYLAKPFHVEELVARLLALSRRGGGQEGSRMTRGDLTLDEDQHTVTVAGAAPVALSPMEYGLLRLLMTRCGRIVSKGALTEHLYDEAAEHDSNVIEAHIRRLRVKIGSERIETLRGHGYRLRAPGR
ncbi:MAG: response regulator transcription factor [Gammaproteobacteria bacterium]|nr:response regulator transcription factor [Gammaproteobacteria bacterium]